VLAALDYAHRATDAQGTPLGIVHRDVSPANVLVSLEGEVRLCDFGIARAFAPDLGLDDEPLMKQALWAGKAWYVAPEHARGEDVDARSDVYAVGVLLWELCAGRRMYKKDDASYLDPERLAVAPPLPDRDFPDMRWLQAILSKALAFDPATRFQSAQDMLAEVEEYALATHLMASQLRFGAFLGRHFEADFAAQRLQRDQAGDRALSEPPVATDASESGPRRLPLPPRAAAAPAPVASRAHAVQPSPARGLPERPSDIELPPGTRPRLSVWVAALLLTGLIGLVWWLTAR
jgi:serine/threonine-protein kinase